VITCFATLFTPPLTYVAYQNIISRCAHATTCKLDSISKVVCFLGGVFPLGFVIAVYTASCLLSGTLSSKYRHHAQHQSQQHGNCLKLYNSLLPTMRKVPTVYAAVRAFLFTSLISKWGLPVPLATRMCSERTFESGLILSISCILASPIVSKYRNSSRLSR
jgi:hypothetical protein